MTEREKTLEAALKFVQTALANWRDEQDIVHPEHGRLNLEEVKYLVVDTALEPVGHCYKMVSTLDGNDEIELSACTEDEAWYEALSVTGWNLIKVV